MEKPIRSKSLSDIIEKFQTKNYYEDENIEHTIGHVTQVYNRLRKQITQGFEQVHNSVFYSGIGLSLLTASGLLYFSLNLYQSSRLTPIHQEHPMVMEYNSALEGLSQTKEFLIDIKEEIKNDPKQEKILQQEKSELELISKEYRITSTNLESTTIVREYVQHELEINEQKNMYKLGTGLSIFFLGLSFGVPMASFMKLRDQEKRALEKFDSVYHQKIHSIRAKYTHQQQESTDS